MRCPLLHTFGAGVVVYADNHLLEACKAAAAVAW